MANSSLRRPRRSASWRDRNRGSVSIALALFVQERPRVKQFARQAQRFGQKVDRRANGHEVQSLSEEAIGPPEIGLFGFRRTDDHRHFAAWRVLFIEGCKRLKVAAANLFMQFRQFTRDSGVALVE